MLKYDYTFHTLKQRERDRGEETEGKRQRGRDREEETERKRQRGREKKRKR
jgi:hypothetical protein